MPEGTLKAFADHGGVDELLTVTGGDSDEVLARFAAAGVDVHALAERLQAEGTTSFVSSWHDLMDVLAAKSAALANAS